MSRGPTGSLFDDEPEQTAALATVLAQRKPTTPGEQEFHRLAARIEAARAQLKQWQAYGARYNQRLAGELAPLHAQLRAGQRQMAQILDEILSDETPGTRAGRGQRTKLKHWLLSLVSGLLGQGPDPALEALHDKYSEVTHEELGQSEIDVTRAMLRDVFGVDVGDDHGASSREELFARAYQQMREREAQESEEPQAKPRSRGSRAKAAKAEAAEAQRAQAAKEVGQSLREVYRKLVSALHPDREPDAIARARKTEMMQRVNQAYEANDLLTLLGLQLEIEQIDAAHLSTVPPQRLAHYNQILREQLADLDSALDRVLDPFRESLGSLGGGRLTPAFVDKRLTAEIAELRRAVRSLEQERVLVRDPRWRVEALRHYRVDDDSEDAAELARLLDQMREPDAPRRGRRRRR